MEAGNQHSSNITMGGAGSGDQLAGTWMERVKKSIENKRKWSQHFNCDRLEAYYDGDQWEPTGTNYEPYVINLIFSTIEIKLPTLLFENPVFHVKPRPRGLAYDLEMAIKRSLLREDLLNTVIGDPEVGFAQEVESCILDSFFRFAVLEVGYSANWVINPNADKPILRSDNRPYTDGNKNIIRQPKELPESERIYAKRIPAANFYVGGLEGSRLIDALGADTGNIKESKI